MDTSSTQQHATSPPSNGLLSPMSSTTGSVLPHPRPSPLRPNSEDQLRRQIESSLQTISRRYVKKFSQSPDPSDTTPPGFTTFTQVADDLDDLVNTLWQSGTPSLQIPFLLRIAGDFTQYVRSFPASPRASLALLGKLDHCFAGLICGRDVDSQEVLPGFGAGSRGGMTMTDMVRCRSLVEQTRVLMVEILGRDDDDDDDDEEEDDSEEEEEEDDDDDDDDEDDGDVDYNIDDQSRLSTTNRQAVSNTHTTFGTDKDRVHLAAARIYENTIIQLGKKLDGNP